MRLRRKRLFLFTLVTLSIVLAQGSLLLHTQEEEKDSRVEKLFKMSLQELMNVKIDTAGKTPERIGDIPASVVLITREDIETYGYRTLTEILENIPGLFGIDDFGDTGSNFGVRGFWSGVANDNMIILVNGVHRVNDFLSNYSLNKILVPVEAIDRIEVIRGPMSVIYGNGAFYGVINIYTNDNSYGTVNMIEAVGGTYKTKKLFARAAGSEGNFSYVFNAAVDDTYGPDEPLSEMMEDPSRLPVDYNTPIDSRTGGRLEDNAKYFNFSGSFKNFSVDVSYNESKKEFYFAYPAVANGTYDRTTAGHIFAKYRKDISDEVTIEGKFTYSQNRDSYQYDHLFEGFYGVQELATNAWEGEFNTFINSLRNLEIAAGLYYRSIFYANNKYDLPSFGVPSLENNCSFLEEGDAIITRALFTQFTYTPIDSLRLVAGIRLEQSPQYKLGSTQTVGDQLISERNAVYDRDKLELIPRLAALYYLNDRNVFKFLYGKAINRPSFFQVTRNYLVPEPNPLEPESIQTFEFNYIGTLSSRFTFNASIFRNTLDKLITRVVQFDNQGNYITWSENAGKMLTYGMELALNIEPLDNLRLELSGTFQNTQDKRDEFKDIEVAYSPKFLGYLKASLRSSRFILALTGDYVGAMETYWDKTKPDPDGIIREGGRIGEKVQGYFLLGANVRFHDLLVDGLFLNLRCSNVLGEEIRYPTFTNNDWATRGTIGIGRTFLVTLGFKF